MIYHGNIKYNPLHKPDLKPQVIANRLKNILLLFSPNNSESYWLDKVEVIFSHAITLCRLYNNGYVTFDEIHKLVSSSDYYREKISILHNNYIHNVYSKEQCFDILSCLSFFEKEYFSLDDRTLSILKSECSRITNLFVSDFQIKNVFSPSSIDELNFNGFSDVLSKGKIVVLNMNISEYRNLSKVIAAYLKLDFQTEVMQNLANRVYSRSVCFISDEYHE